jgi:MYXO-CTERM domain-containing protein
MDAGGTTTTGTATPSTGTGTTATSASACVPRSLLPCTTPSDCGAGFNCYIPQYYNCSTADDGGVPPTRNAEGGVIYPAYDSGAPPANPTDGGPALIDDAAAIAVDVKVDPYPACVATPASTGYCQAQTITCTDASQCPSNWACQQTATVGCAYGSVDGAVYECDAGPQPPMQCVPPSSGYSSGGFQRLADGGYLALPPMASEDAGVNGSANTGAGGGSGSHDTTTGTGTGTSTVAATDTSTTTATATGTAASTGTALGAAPTEPPSNEEGGCSVSQYHPNSSSSLGWLAALGLLGLVARRRRAS